MLVTYYQKQNDKRKLSKKTRQLTPNMLFRKVSCVSTGNTCFLYKTSNPISHSVHLPLSHSCNVKALTDLTAVQKMQLHSWRVVILSREYSQRHSLQVRRGSRANSPASDLSAVMVWGQSFSAEPIQSLMVPSAWKEKSAAETLHKPCSHFHSSENLHLRSIKVPAYPNVLLNLLGPVSTSDHSKFTKRANFLKRSKLAGFSEDIYLAGTSVRLLNIKIKEKTKQTQNKIHTDGASYIHTCMCVSIYRYIYIYLTLPFQMSFRLILLPSKRDPSVFTAPTHFQGMFLPTLSIPVGGLETPLSSARQEQIPTF